MLKSPRAKQRSVAAPVSVAPLYDAQIEKEGDYKLTAFISNKEQKVRGRSLLECLEKLVKDHVVKGKCTLQVEKAGLKSSIQLSPMKIKRLLFNKVFREIIAKRLNLRLT